MTPLPRTAARPPCIGIPLFPARERLATADSRIQISRCMAHGPHVGRMVRSRTESERTVQRRGCGHPASAASAQTAAPRLQPIGIHRRGHRGATGHTGRPNECLSEPQHGRAGAAIAPRKSRQRRRGLCRTASRPTRGAARAVDRRCDDHRFDLAGMRRGDTRSSTGLPDQHRCIGRRAPRMGNERISGGAQTPMKMPRQSVVFSFRILDFSLPLRPKHPRKRWLRNTPPRPEIAKRSTN